MITWTAMNTIDVKDKYINKEEINNLKSDNKISVIYGKVSDFTNVFSNLLLSPLEY